jgi:hypothetical protein
VCCWPLAGRLQLCATACLCDVLTPTFERGAMQATVLLYERTEQASSPPSGRSERPVAPPGLEFSDLGT